MTFVALASDATGVTRCVGEAGFVPRGDGTAEFALSVAVERRGGLGSILLEYLRHAAAARGIHALHGDMLTSNHAMRHMLQRRGAGTIDSDDGWTSSLLPTGRDGSGPGHPASATGTSVSAPCAPSRPTTPAASH